eukprot:5424652-Alexandrium_andersonii.AAC.1
MQQAHALRAVVLAWAGETRHLRPVPFSTDPPGWRPAAWAAKLLQPGRAPAEHGRGGQARPGRALQRCSLAGDI